MLEIFKKVKEWFVATFSDPNTDMQYVEKALSIVNQIKEAVINDSGIPQIADEMLPIVESAIEELGLISKGTLETVNGLVAPLISLIGTASRQHQHMIYHKLASNITVGLSGGQIPEHVADTIVQVHYSASKSEIPPQIKPNPTVMKEITLEIPDFIVKLINDIKDAVAGNDVVTIGSNLDEINSGLVRLNFYLNIPDVTPDMNQATAEHVIAQLVTELQGLTPAQQESYYSILATAITEATTISI